MAIQKIRYADHDEWLRIRRQYIGGSDAGAIMGMNPYKSAFTLWGEKTGAVKEFEGNTITEVGAFLEEFVAEQFTRATGLKVQRCNFTLVNDLYPWACANVDRMVIGEDAILECKTTNSMVNVKKFRNGEYPEQWYCQMTHYLGVTGKKRAYLAVLSECRNFYVYQLERDEDEIAALMRSEEIFWDKVQRNIPPAPDGSDGTAAAIAEMCGASNGETIELPGIETLMERRMMLKDTSDKLKDQIGEIENQIKLAMGMNEKAVCGKWNISWKSQQRSTFDKDKFLADHPESGIEDYFKVTESRVFRVTESRKKRGSA